MKLLKTFDGLHTIYSARYKQTYHSKYGVQQEARHVFLEGSGFLSKLSLQKDISVLEIGFGSGFNFFLSAELAITKQVKLKYYAFEKDLLAYNVFKRLNHNTLFAENPVWLNFLAWRKRNANLKEKIYSIVHDDIQLMLICTEAVNFPLPGATFDAVYHDAFSPDVNPELWTVSFFKQIKLSMKEGAQLSTYSAKGRVKRALAEAGFFIEKRPGPKGKREMLVAKNI